MGNTPSSGSALPPLPSTRVDECIRCLAAPHDMRTQRIGVMRDAASGEVAMVVCTWTDITSNTPQAAEVRLDEQTMELITQDLPRGALSGARLYGDAHLRSLRTGVPGLRRCVTECRNSGGDVRVVGTTQHLHDLTVRWSEDTGAR